MTRPWTHEGVRAPSNDRPDCGYDFTRQQRRQRSADRGPPRLRPRPRRQGARRCNLPRHVEQDELEGFALLGLTEAAGGFDPELGIKFTSFAYNRIVGAILNGLAKLRGLSAKHADDLRATDRAESALPNAEESSFNGSVDTAAEGIKNAARATALSLMFSDCARGEATDNDTPDDHAAQRELAAMLPQVIAQLDEPSRQLVQYLYYDRLTTAEAGEKLGIDKANVSRRHRKILAQLGELMHAA